MRNFKRLSILLVLATVAAVGLWWLQLQGSEQIPANWPLEKIFVSLVYVVITSTVCWLIGALNHSVQNNTGLGSKLRNLLSVESDERVLESIWVTWMIYLTAWMALPVILLRQWGLTDASSELFGYMATAGFPVGKTQVVPGKILLGLVLFAALVTLTRWFRNRLNRRWLSRTPMHPGTREAVATMFGYITFVLALLAGLSIAGFDLTNLAIMAGALGVGIGFGLQNIVNNFISGIILLFERPIRPGDYITVGQTTGFVRNVSIRSTEMETLDRMSVIVPNSDLLTTHVHNWTLRDPYGRITVPVGVAYGSDTELVKTLLLEAAHDHPDIIKENSYGLPSPVVFFRGFGDSSLDFELRVFIRQIDRRLAITSELNFAIDQAFREHGVTIPFPQRDVWFKNTMTTTDQEAS